MRKNLKYFEGEFEGLDEECIYSDDFRESMIENDEIDSWEDGFMRGYDNAG